MVTGASTGIGAATARELARRGFHVFAGVRRGPDADALRATNLEPIRLDITNEAEIAAQVKRIADYPGRCPLRALVNNAGVAVNAPVEVLRSRRTPRSRCRSGRGACGRPRRSGRRPCV